MEGPDLFLRKKLMDVVSQCEPRHRRPYNEARNELYCEGDDELMAKHGDRDWPNPRQCPSFEPDALTGRRSTDSIRTRGKQYAASRGLIDDCKPNPLQPSKTLAIRGASIDDNACRPIL